MVLSSPKLHNRLHIFEIRIVLGITEGQLIASFGFEINNLYQKVVPDLENMTI
ncbi:hypothetical protein FDUTEX481_05393 [Tolypothrix sp. PCC 7601]|nr:hypothetical protein FDUTEX481_05393 [Tolypothrix sp. PCC 7601]